MTERKKKLKLFNGSDWKCRDGHLYVAAYSIQDACDLSNEAYRKIKGYVDRPGLKMISTAFIRDYWGKGCWGISMDGVPVERGVWWSKGRNEKPERVL